VRQSGGFTLLELLISMSMLSLVVLIGSSAYGLFAQRWDGQLGRFDTLLHEAKNIVLVQSVLDSLIPYIAFDDRGRPFNYFEGNRNGFVAVASRSIYSEGDFSVVRFSTVQNDDLSFDVFYEEWPMNRSLLVSTTQLLNFSKPITIFESVESPKFEYFGWNDIRQKETGDLATPPPLWTDSYNGLEAWFAPMRARLTFVTDEGPFQIEASLASEKRGLLSRYKNKSYKVDSEGYRNEDIAPADDVSHEDHCDC